MTRRAALYCRISRDRVGAGLGVERQEADCRELAERLGVAVVAVHTDNDLSAYSGKPRPGYRVLLAQVESGEVDIVLCWHTDRLHRSPSELEAWITACEPHGVGVHTVKAGPLDLASPSGRMVARQLGAVARYEVEHMIERQKAAKAQAAASGKYRGGRRPFGYESDGVTLRETEAQIVENLTERALAGESLASLARDLNDRGVTTSTGRTWRPPEVRSMLLRARNAGLVEHNGNVVGEAQWPEIVDPATWRSLHRMLTADGRRAPRSAEIVYLGSGLFRCGHCDDGTTMAGASTRTTTSGRKATSKASAYRCRRGSHLTRIAAPLDAMISELVIRRLSRPDARLLMHRPDDQVDVELLHRRRADIDARLTEAAGMFADGTLTGAQLAEATRRLRAEGEGLDAQLSTLTGVSPLAGFADAEDVAAAWNAATVGRRKTVVKALMGVTLLPAPKGRPVGWKPGAGYFDPRSVLIDWRVSN